MENLRNRTVVKLVRAGEEAKLRKLLSSPFFASAAVFGESLAGIQMHKERILMNKPVYTGMCVLDLSKILMYKFYYQHLKYKYGTRCELLYTDTDSLLLEIKTEDFYEDMGRHLELYATSDYPEDHPLHSQENKSPRQDEGRVQRQANLRGRLPALQDVLHFDRGRRKQKESEGHHQSRNKERDQPPELQGRGNSTSTGWTCSEV